MICHPYRRGRIYWGKLQLTESGPLLRFSLDTTDKRVAWERLNERRTYEEKLAAGLLPPQSVRDGAATPLSLLLDAFLEDLRVQGRATTTGAKYRKTLAKLFGRCRWRLLPDITARAFCEWRARAGLSPKTLNDLLGALSAFLGWLVHQRLLAENPLEHVRRIDTRGTHQPYRRSFKRDEVARLLAVAPASRRIVYQVAVFTGLRRTEMMGLRWGDFVLVDSQPHVVVRPNLAGNKGRKHVRIPLHPELVDALLAFRPPGVAPFTPALAGLVPRLPRFRKDLVEANIPFEDEGGRRADLHALRDTFITELFLAGNPPEVVMKLARHSDLRTTFKYYVDGTRLPLAEGLAKLPGFKAPQVCPQTCPNLGLSGSQAVAT